MKIQTITIAILAAAGSLLAAGYQIQEQGASNIGTAMAGSVTNANNDASAAYWNPSAIAFSGLEEGETIIDAGLSFVMPTLDFHDTGSQDPFHPEGSKSASAAPMSEVPNMYAAHRFNESMYATFSFSAPYGLESDYDENWVGRYQGINSYVMTMDLNPSFVYQVNDWLSIGCGLSAQYIYASLSNMLPPGVLGGGKLDISGYGWGIGGNAGFTIKYAEGGKFAFAWRSAVGQDLDGTMRTGSLSYDISTSITNPDTFTFGIYQKFLKNFAVMADYTLTRWSVFDKLEINGGPIPIKENENWKDTSRVSLGFHYYPDFLEGATFRIGAAFDETPVSELRTVRIPCCDRVWLSTGLGFKYKFVEFDVGYTYIFLIGDGKIDSADYVNRVTGYYDGHIQVVSIQASIKF